MSPDSGLGSPCPLAWHPTPPCHALHLPTHWQGPPAGHQGSAKEKLLPSQEASGLVTRGPLSREATLAF